MDLVKKTWALFHRPQNALQNVLHGDKETGSPGGAT